MANIHGKPDPISLFREMVYQEQRKQNDIDRIVIPVLQSGEIPTPDNVREAINSCVGDSRNNLLRNHVYWKERQLRLGLESLISAAHQAYIDICRHDAALGALASRKEFQEHVDHSIGYTAQKDMVAYCSLADGVREILCKIKKLRCDIKDKIQMIEEDAFNNQISDFIRMLRNKLLHGEVMIPQWNITYESQRQTSVGTMTYTAKELINIGNWSKKSTKYISSFNDEKISLSEVVRDHFGCLNQLNRKMTDLFARNITETEKDFFDIEDSHKKEARRQWMKILISQIGKDQDPYDHLHRFFDPETLREIFRLPRHSREQVDFIISLKISEIDCDDDLRNLLYDTFGVRDKLEKV